MRCTAEGVRLEKTPKLSAVRAGELRNAPKSASGSPHLRDTSSASLPPSSLRARCENGPRDSEQRLQNHVGKRDKEGGRRPRESNLIPLFMRQEFRLALSGAGPKVVTPWRREGVDVGGAVLTQACRRGLPTWVHILT